MTLDVDLVTRFVSIGAAIFGIAFGVYQLWQRHRAERRAEINRFVLNAIEHMTGGSQERNVGVSVIAHHWQDAKHLRGLFIRVLTNQAIYVARHGKVAKAHELSNLRRMIDLLAMASKADRESFATFYEELETELVRAETLYEQLKTELERAERLDPAELQKLRSRLPKPRS